MTDFFNLTAQRIHNMPADWRWCSLDGHKKPEDFFEVKGAVPAGVISRGPNKGRTKWPKQLQTLWMRMSDVDRIKHEWEQETGKCYLCDGQGEEVASFSATDGKTMRECSRCKGARKPPVDGVKK